MSLVEVNRANISLVVLIGLIFNLLMDNNFKAVWTTCNIWDQLKQRKKLLMERVLIIKAHITNIFTIPMLEIFRTVFINKAQLHW